MTPDQPSASELVDRVLRTLVHSPDDAVADAADAGASALAAFPAGPAAVSSALLAAAEREVRRAWENGWQPADLVRLVRRDLGPHQADLTLDLIAAEGRRCADADLSPRWAAQLRELGAAVRWEDDGSHLAAFAARHRLDRFTATGAALELLRLVARLPRITPVAPPPGAAHRTARCSGAAPAPRLLARVRALLAKAEATPYPEEAEAFTAKAQHLATRYSIDEALLAADAAATDPHGPGACRIGVDEPYAAAKAVLLDAVAAANHCRSVWSSDLGFSTVVGHEPDLAAVELLHASLLAQATAAMNRDADRHHRSGRSRRTRDFRQTFLVAFAGRIRSRLAAAADEATAEAADEAAGNGAAGARRPLLPVLAAREVAVDDATDRMFPTTTSHRLRGRDLAGWEHGTAAADRVRLGGDRPNPHDGRTS